MVSKLCCGRIPACFVWPTRPVFSFLDRADADYCTYSRIDLRPPTAGDPNDPENTDPDSASAATAPTAGTGESADAAANGNLQPSDARRQSRRFSSFIFNPLNRQRMQEATPEERIQALRQYNAQRQERSMRPDDSRRRRISARLSGVFAGGRRRDEDSSADGSRSQTPAAGATGEVPVEAPALSPLSFEQRHHDRTAGQSAAPVSPIAESDAIEHAPTIQVQPPEADKGKAREEEVDKVENTTNKNE